MSDELPVAVLADGVVRLETKSCAFVGWSKIPPFVRPPDVLMWGDRVFTYRGFLDGAIEDRGGPAPYLLYREAFSAVLLAPVGGERPAP